MHFLSAFILLAYLMLSLSVFFNELISLKSAKMIFKFGLLLQAFFLLIFLYTKSGINFLNAGDYFFALSFILPLGFSLFALEKSPVKLIALVSGSTFLLFACSGYLTHLSTNTNQENGGSLFMLLHVFPLIIGEVAFLTTTLLGIFYLNQEKLIKRPVRMLPIDFSTLSLERLSKLIKISSTSSLIALLIGAISGFFAFSNVTEQLAVNDFAIWFLFSSCAILIIYIILDWRSILSKKMRISFITYTTLALLLSFTLFRVLIGNTVHGS